MEQITEVEKPMKMNYREAYAWQLGYNEGWKQCYEECGKIISIRNVGEVKNERET